MSFSYGDPYLDYINTILLNEVTVTCPLLSPRHFLGVTNQPTTSSDSAKGLWHRWRGLCRVCTGPSAWWSLFLRGPGGLHWLPVLAGRPPYFWENLCLERLSQSCRLESVIGKESRGKVGCERLWEEPHGACRWGSGSEAVASPQEGDCLCHLLGKEVEVWSSEKAETQWTLMLSEAVANTIPLPGFLQPSTAETWRRGVGDAEG